MNCIFLMTFCISTWSRQRRRRSASTHSISGHVLIHYWKIYRPYALSQIWRIWVRNHERTHVSGNLLNACSWLQVDFKFGFVVRCVGVTMHVIKALNNEFLILRLCFVSSDEEWDISLSQFTSNAIHWFRLQKWRPSSTRAMKIPTSNPANHFSRNSTSSMVHSWILVSSQEFSTQERAPSPI